jgi:hypothetical protein
MKINEGASGAKVHVHWDKEKHLWAPDGSSNPIERAAAAAPIDDAFMRCLDAATTQGRLVSPKANVKIFAPRVFTQMPEAGGYAEKALVMAMERHFSAGRIKVGRSGGSPSKQFDIVVRA